ncbi:transmembrane protein 147-like [Sarcoptes scabiei]|nr:transmembrane protein 147-like [Sarcoptes scabiei]
MSNICFNGDFRRKPEQRFSGVNRNLQRDQLIKQAAQERKQREEFRKHTKLAIKLQSQIRKFLACKKWHEYLRFEFDEKLGKFRDCNRDSVNLEPTKFYNDLHYLALRLSNFYQYPLDRERLSFLNDVLIQNKDLIINVQQNHQKIIRCVWLKQLFRLNASYLVHLLDQFPNNFHIFKNIVNLFNLYLNFQILNAELKTRIWQHLIENNYFKSIQIVFSKIRSIGSIDDDFQRKIHEILLNQLFITNGFDYHPQRMILIKNFFIQFLSESTDFKYLNSLLESLCERKSSLLAVDNLIEVFLSIDHSSIPTLQYLIMVYSFFKLTIQPLNDELDGLNFSYRILHDYLEILKLFSMKLSNYFRIKPRIVSLLRKQSKSQRDSNYEFHNGIQIDQSTNGFHSNNTLNEDNVEDDLDGDDDDDEYLNVDLDSEKGYHQKNSTDDAILLCTGLIFRLLNSTDHCNLIVRFIDQITNEDHRRNHSQKCRNSLVSLTNISYLMFFFDPHAIHQNRLLHTLAFNADFLIASWQSVLNERPVSLPSQTIKNDETDNDCDGETPLTFFDFLSKGLMNNQFDWNDFIPHLTIFCALFNYFLQTLDDVEFFHEFLMEDVNNNPNNYSVLPFKLKEIQSMSAILRDACISLIEFAYQDRRIMNITINILKSSGTLEAIRDEFSINCWSLLLRCLLRLLTHIHARGLRKTFCPENHWISKRTCIRIQPQNFNIAIKQRKLYQEFRGVKQFKIEDILHHGSLISVKDVINVTLIQELPFVASFYDRVKIMQSLITYEKVNTEIDFFDIIDNRSISIRRDYVYEDSFEKLSSTSIPTMKKTIRVQLISSFGLEETGVDGGGIFREFLSEALKSAFDPNRGLFKLTSDSLLYPNPSAKLLYNNSDSHYYFIGRLLGKAIYEHMLIELPFAPFFLAKILTWNSQIEINHLASLDPVLYKNLISLKNYSGDVSELGLDFTVVQSDFGTNQIEELKPNGSNIPVTNQNRIEYIHLMADYKLNKQIRMQCSAFKQGFYNVVDFEWIKMFDTRELQILISGAQTPIDIDDLANHTMYSGSYTPDHPVIKNFWETVAEFDENEKKKLLKFVTSCSRAPLLGFKDLCPPFCIQNAGTDPERLPTSSTCMNLLKLPEIHDKKTMKEKLIYSINSGSGFELS